MGALGTAAQPDDFQYQTGTEADAGLLTGPKVGLWWDPGSNGGSEQLLFLRLNNGDAQQVQISWDTNPNDECNYRTMHSSQVPLLNLHSHYTEDAPC